MHYTKSLEVVPHSPSMAAYLTRHGPFFVHLVLRNQKA